MNQADPSSPVDPQSSSSPPRRRRRRWLFAGGLGLAALAGLCATRAWADHGRFGRAQTQEELRDRLDRAADFALGRVNATDTQRRRIDAILDQAAPQLFAVQQKGHGLKTAFIEAVASGNESAAETTRKQALAWADEASKLYLGTLEQALAVLDDKQRAEVREHLKRFADHGGHHRGHGRHHRHHDGGSAGTGAQR